MFTNEFDLCICMYIIHILIFSSQEDVLECVLMAYIMINWSTGYKYSLNLKLIELINLWGNKQAFRNLDLI